MKRTIGLVALGLAVCLVLQVAASVDGNRQELPYFSIKGSATLVIDTTTGYWAYVNSGIANHVGPVDNFATGLIDQQGWLTGTGTVTTNNGDQIFYDAAGPLGGAVVVTLTGGTGRFVNVSGQLTLGEPQNLETIQHGPLMIQRSDASFEGWISY
jgi:hypothetical protein